MAIHFAHRVGALVAFCAILATAIRVWREHSGDSRLTRPAGLLVILVLVQGTLGAFVIWSGLHPVINTAHVANGALVSERLWC